jgi:hypothetical protein
VGTEFEINLEVPIGLGKGTKNAQYDHEPTILPIAPVPLIMAAVSAHALSVRALDTVHASMIGPAVRVKKNEY